MSTTQSSLESAAGDGAPADEAQGSLSLASLTKTFGQGDSAVTAVDHVAINFGKPDQKDLEEINVEEAKKYVEEGQFGKGSMEPKVKAGIKFAESRPGRVCIIGSLDKAAEAMAGLSGTRITA